MKIQENIPLSTLTTMRIGGAARYVVTVESRDDVRSAIRFAEEKQLPWFALGGGSNVVAGQGFNGVIILNTIKGLEKVSDDAGSETYRVGAGEMLDDIIEKVCANNLSGIECLSLIPGTIGATPVQNVGAYGQEISQTLVELMAFDARTNEFVVLSNEECQFSYRDSIFKSQKDRHYIICDITFRFTRQPLARPFYPALESYIEEHEIDDFTPSSIRQMVIAIRNSKLPPISETPSAGSFFKNPIVPRETANNLLAKFPDAPHWPMPDGREKLAAGWLIDQAGLKGYEQFGFQLYPKNALVITNISDNNTAENLAKFKAEIISIVQEKFGVTLEQEPESLSS
jgi:UDP-N-acetylmuramate dehydrogenase